MQRDRLLLHEIIDAAERILVLTAGITAETLENERTTREALMWSYTVLGEACGRLSEELKMQHPGVPWRSPLALRNRIVHGYWQVSTSILIVTAEDDIPGFLTMVRDVLQSVEVEAQ